PQRRQRRPLLRARARRRLPTRVPRFRLPRYRRPNEPGTTFENDRLGMTDGLSSDQPILITVEARAQGWRVDHYLSRLFPNFSRALFQRAIEQQTILVNGIPVKTSRRLRM